MSLLLKMGTKLMCPFGSANPGLIVLPTRKVTTEGSFTANIDDHKSMVNILPFGLCSSGAYPPVIAANGAPQPCIPNTPGPWTSEVTNVLIRGKPAIHMESSVRCLWNGVIKALDPAQKTTMKP